MSRVAAGTGSAIGAVVGGGLGFVAASLTSDIDPMTYRPRGSDLEIMYRLGMGTAIGSFVGGVIGAAVGAGPDAPPKTGVGELPHFSNPRFP